MLSVALTGCPGLAAAAEPEWTNVGPAVLAVRAIVLERGDHPNRSPGRIILYAGTSGSGVFRSADGGETWTAKNTGLANLDIRALAIHQREIPSRAPITHYETVIYAGTPLGVFRTLDDGTTWTAVNTGLPALNVNAIVTDPAGTVYASNLFGAFKSTDLGATWVSITPGDGRRSGFGLTVDPGPPVALYAGLDGSILRSENGGESWTDLSPTRSSVFLFNPIAIRISPFSAAIFTAGFVDCSICGMPPNPVVFKSDDRGASWIVVDGIPDIVSDLAFPDESTVLAALFSTGVSWSADGGTTWQAANTGFPSDQMNFGARQLVSDPISAGTTYAATGQGIFRSGPVPDAGLPRAIPKREDFQIPASHW